MRVGKIRAQTRIGKQGQGLRTEVIQETLARLTRHDTVAQTQLNKRHAYHLTDSGRKDPDEEAAESASQLFEPVLARMLKDTHLMCDKHDGATVCRTFISECFARFGQQIARAVTGGLSNDQLVNRADVEGAFQAAANLVQLSLDAKQSLKARCVRFLKSTERDDEELKFRLTQGYFVTQLLSLDVYSFNPLADDAFRDSVFFIDSNVLFYKLLSDEGARLFVELVRICNVLEIELQVSRATINEMRRVAADRLEGLEKTLAKAPAELVNRTRDDFLDAFLAERDDNPEVTVEVFLGRFDEIPELLAPLGIKLYDHTIDEIISGQDVAWECEVVRDAAMTNRGWGKSETVCRHDVCHYLLIEDERRRGRKAWFLTRDKTLYQAAQDLGSDGPPFCFPLAGFLQSVSPFLEAPEFQRSLAGLFSAVLNGEIGDLSEQSEFDLQELKIISEFHTDVLSTPVDQLLPAFDYVKNAVLGGKSYRREDLPKVALELKKHLTSSMEKKQRGLQAELTRMKDKAAAQRAGHELETDKRQAEIIRLKTELEEASCRHADDAKRNANLSTWVAVLGVFMAIGIWTFDSELVSVIMRILSLDSGFDGVIHSGVRLMGAALVFFVCLSAIARYKRVYQLGIGTVIVAIALGGSNLVNQAEVDTISGYLEIGAPIALIIMAALERSRRRPSG